MSSGGEKDPLLGDFAVFVGLPDSIADRPLPRSRKSVDELLNVSDRQVEEEGRNFHLGLMIAFLAVVEEMCERAEKDPLVDGLKLYPPLEERGGRRLNTLTLPSPNGGRAVGLRGYYNRVEEAIRFKYGKRGYPSMAPHATQAWSQHRSELESIFAMSPLERGELARGLWERVLALPTPPYRSADQAAPRPFTFLLENFESAQREPPGVTFQALAYGFFNVELRHLVAVESDKVRAGGARSGNVGDIDGWDGASLVASVEVKDLDLTSANQHELHGFLANLVPWPDCTAIVAANSVSDDVLVELEERNIVSITREEMVARSAEWDLPKQRSAMLAVEYNVIRVQAHDGFSRRFLDFLGEHELGPS